MVNTELDWDYGRQRPPGVNTTCQQGTFVVNQISLLWFCVFGLLVAIATSWLYLGLGTLLAVRVEKYSITSDIVARRSKSVET